MRRTLLTISLLAVAVPARAGEVRVIGEPTCQNGPPAPLMLETGERGPGADRSMYEDGRYARLTPATYPAPVVIPTLTGNIVQWTDPDPRHVVWSKDCWEVLSVLPLDAVVGFRSMGVVCTRLVCGTDLLTVSLRVMDLRTSGEVKLTHELPLGERTMSRPDSGPPAIASYCHLGVKAVDGAALVLDLDRCSAAPPPDLAARLGRWCFDASQGWAKCAR